MSEDDPGIVEELLVSYHGAESRVTSWVGVAQPHLVGGCPGQRWEHPLIGDLQEGDKMEN